MPESAAAQVKELFVPESRIATAKREAGQLAALDINQVYNESLLSSVSDAQSHFLHMN